MKSYVGLEASAWSVCSFSPPSTSIVQYTMRFGARDFSPCTSMITTYTGQPHLTLNSNSDECAGKSPYWGAFLNTPLIPHAENAAKQPWILGQNNHPNQLPEYPFILHRRTVGPFLVSIFHNLKTLHRNVIYRWF